MVKQTIRIDLSTNRMPETVYAVQGDKNSRIVHIELVAGNFEWNIPDGSTVLVKFLKSDGKAGLFDKLPDGTTAATFEPDTNKVDITLAPQMLTCAGKVETQVSFIYDESIISTFTFVVLVQADPSASHDVSTDYVNWDKMFMPQATDANVGEYLQVDEVDEHGRVKKISSRNVFENLEEIKLSDIDGYVGLRIDSRSSDAGFHNVLLIDSENQSVDGGTVLSGISKGTEPLDAVNKQQLDESLEKVVTDETLAEELSDYVDDESLRNELEEKTIPQTTGAKVGQYLKITKVDSLGRVVEVSPVDAPSDSNSDGLTTEQISAIDGMFKICAYTTDATDAYKKFKTAFGIDGEAEPDEPDGEQTLTGISATYSGGDVVVGTAVSALTGIVVTAHYSDGSTETVTGYTLSGEIAEGENTVIVSYGGKTTTITVTGVADTQAPVTLEPVVTGNCTIQTSAITEGAVPDTVLLISSGSVCRVFALESGKTYEISGDAAYDSVYPYPPFVIADISWDKKLPTSGSSNISNKSLYCPVVPSDYSNWGKMTAEYTATVDCYAIVSGSYDVIQK